MSSDLVAAVVDGKLAKARCPICTSKVEVHTPVGAWLHATQASERGLKALEPDPDLGGPTLAFGGEGDKDGPALTPEQQDLYKQERK